MVSASAGKEATSETPVSTREVAMEVKIVIDFIFVEAVSVNECMIFKTIMDDITQFQSL